MAKKREIGGDDVDALTSEVTRLHDEVRTLRDVLDET